MPAKMESHPLPLLIAEVNDMLKKPEADRPEVRLRILTVKGMLELEYDAGIAEKTWAQVEQLARKQGQYRLASRASGEQGILAFLLGDVAEATRRVKRAYMMSKVLRDPAAEVRYASLIGRGIVEFGRYQESLTMLDRAISLAESHPEIAKPMIAYEAKADASIGLKRYGEARRLIDHFLDLSRPLDLRENLAEGLSVKGSVLEADGNWRAAIDSYLEAISYAKSVSHFHSLNDINAKLARAYEHERRFDEALKAIDAAIAANKQTPDEIYYVPRNFAIKAEIEVKSGHGKQAESLYRQGSDVVDVLLRHVPTPLVERSLLSELSELYSGYFNLLSDEKRFAEAFDVIERAHGRIEAQSLRYDTLKPPQEQTPEERTLNGLEVQLLDTPDQVQRDVLLKRIYEAEQAMSPDPLETSENPVRLEALQRRLTHDEVVLEYVLSEPNSSVLAITSRSVNCYTLPAKTGIERDSTRYIHELAKKQTDLALARRLFESILPAAPELSQRRTVIVVPDGALNVLPFAALADAQAKYLVSTKTIVKVPSGTVLNLLRTRARNQNPIPYLGVAAWTQTTDVRPWIVRAVSGPERSQLVPLPESKREIEMAAGLLPQPDTLLLGSTATRIKFLSLPLARYDVLHLSLHGYADMEFPDRSALVFAPAPELNDSGFLKARDIRRLHLNARLVTLSACNTGTGPVFGSGAATIVNAFIEAGAQSVVSTLWDVEDRSGGNLISTFYRHLAEGHGRAESLREAELELVNSGQPPYYWANFQIVGDATGPLFSGRKLASDETRQQQILRQ